MPWNRKDYPDDWEDLRRQVLERAGNCCEGSPGFYEDCRAANGQPHPVTGSRVVLTVAHLDHNPQTRDLAKLRAMCQRCHNRYDAKHRASTRRRKRLERQGNELLFS